MTDHFTVRVMSGSVAGVNRAIVLVGEAHVKGSRDSEIGKSILRAFKNYGLEGADVDLTWGGRLFSLTLDAAFFVIRIASLGRLNQGSTIDDAYLDSLSEDWDPISELVDIIDKYQLNELTPEERERLLIPYNGKMISGERVLTLLEQVKKKYGDMPRAFSLERGHQPDLQENLFSIMYPAMFAWSLYQVASAPFKLASVVASGDTTHALVHAGVAAGVVATSFVAYRVIRRYRPMFIPGVLNAVGRFIFGRGRDKTMVKNMKDIFENNRDLTTLLVLVGKAHIPCMQSLLESRYGFKSQRLDQIQLDQEK